jgi:hypothetical protein
MRRIACSSGSQVVVPVPEVGSRNPSYTPPCRTSALLLISTIDCVKRFLYPSTWSPCHQLVGIPISTSTQSFFLSAFCAPRIFDNSVYR